MEEFEKELRVDTFTNSAPGGSMRVIHLPSGQYVQGETTGSMWQLRSRLYAQLKKKVEEYEQASTQVRTVDSSVIVLPGLLSSGEDNADVSNDATIVVLDPDQPFTTASCESSSGSESSSPVSCDSPMSSD